MTDDVLSNGQRGKGNYRGILSRWNQLIHLWRLDRLPPFRIISSRSVRASVIGFIMVFRGDQDGNARHLAGLAFTFSTPRTIGATDLLKAYHLRAIDHAGGEEAQKTALEQYCAER